MRRVLLALIAAVTLVSVGFGVAVAASPSSFFSVNGPRLAHSLHKSVPGGRMGSCRPEQAGVWQCSVEAGSRDGWAAYRMRVGAHNCWKGRLASRSGFEGPMPERAKGCVTLRDVLRMNERLGGG